MAEKDRLMRLRDRLLKSEDETVRLKEAIAKEEKRLREKERRDNEKWWRELSKKTEEILISQYGTGYKTLIDQETLINIIRQGANALAIEDEEENIDTDKYRIDKSEG